MGDLAGQGAIVTGAAGGLGARVARALAAAGARVVLADRDAPEIARFAKDIDGYAVTVDATDEASVGLMAYHAFDLLEDIDTLVNAPSTGQAAEVDTTSPVVRHILPSMKARRRGVILNVAGTVSDRLATSVEEMVRELSPFGLRINALVADGPSTEIATRPAVPREVGAAAVFLCSDAGAGITGQLLQVQGVCHL